MASLMAGFADPPATRPVNVALAHSAGRTMVDIFLLAVIVIAINVCLIRAYPGPLDEEELQQVEPLVLLVKRRTLLSVDVPEKPAPNPYSFLDAIRKGAAAEAAAKAAAEAATTAAAKANGPSNAKVHKLPPNGKLPVTFVTSYAGPLAYHVGFERKAPEKSVQCLISAQFHHPGAETVILTRNGTAPAEAKKYNISVVDNHVMRKVGRGLKARYDAWQKFVETAIENDDFRHIIFVDEDILFVKNIAEVVEPGLGSGPFVGPGGTSSSADWAVALTYCNGSSSSLSSHKLPQTGLVIVNGRQLRQARDFFLGAVHLMELAHGDRYISWHADRKLMGRALDPANSKGPVAPAEWYYTRGVNGVKVLMLPCTKYNWSPWRPYVTGNKPSDAIVKVVHFKSMQPLIMWNVWLALRTGRNLKAALSTLPFPKQSHPTRVSRDELDDPVDKPWLKNLEVPDPKAGGGQFRWNTFDKRKPRGTKANSTAPPVGAKKTRDPEP